MKRRRMSVRHRPAHFAGLNKNVKELISTVIYCITAVAVVYLLTGVIFGIAVVKGESMQPTLREGDVVIYYRLCNRYERDDIVLVKTDEFKKDYIKRVCGLPGESVCCGTNGCFKVNNEVQNEPYIYEETYSKTGKESVVRLNEKQYFVMGDNRTDSRDSRDYGGVSAKDIAGRSLLILRTY